MPKSKIPEITLRYIGLFDFDGLYAAMIDWAKNYGYLWHEYDYKHKIPSPKGADQEFKWNMEKEISDYIKYTISFHAHLWDITEIEVEIDGKKKSLMNARIYIKINGHFEYDWQQKFAKGGKVAKKLGEWYANFVFKKELDAVYGDQLYYRVWNLHAVLKKYFDMQSKYHAYKHYLGEH